MDGDEKFKISISPKKNDDFMDGNVAGLTEKLSAQTDKARGNKPKTAKASLKTTLQQDKPVSRQRNKSPEVCCIQAAKLLGFISLEDQFLNVAMGTVLACLAIFEFRKRV